MTAIDTLLQRNAVFAEQRFTPNLPLATTLGITVIGCVDPRVDPAHVLGLELGEAAVLRNIGGRGTPAPPRRPTPPRRCPRPPAPPPPPGGEHPRCRPHNRCRGARL